MMVARLCVVLTCINLYLPGDQVRAALLEVPFKHRQALYLLTAGWAQVRNFWFVVPGCEGLWLLVRAAMINSLGNSATHRYVDI